MKRWRTASFMALSLLVALAASMPLVISPAAAQEDVPTDDEVNAIAKELYCPVCANVPLDACETQACVQWRDTIREKLAAGWDEAQIQQYFVDQYGDRVLATPPPTGLNWLVYVLPPLALLVGAYVLYRALRAWRRDAAAADVDVPPVADDPYVARLEEELRRRS
jgi:cytochrome c-type biogenesis protein CcmH